MTTRAVPDVDRPVRHRPNAVLAVACVASFMGILDVSIVNVALPSMRADLGLSPGGLQWVVNGYTLTYAGLLLVGGRAADLLGRRPVFIAGLAVFTVASLLGGLATEGWQLVAARALQGVGGAVFTPATLTLVTTTFVEPRERARALAIWSGVASAGGALGGVIGGVLTGLLSWRWVLIVNVPIGLAVLAAAWWVLAPEPRRPLRGRLDLTGAALVTAASSCLIGGLVGSEQHGWGAPSTLGLLGAAVVLGAAFVLVERRAAHPLVPLGVFRVRSLALANGLSLLTAGLIPAIFFFVSLHLQQGLRMPPLEAGLALLPAGLGIVVGLQTGPRLLRRFRPRSVYCAACLVSVVGLLLLSRIGSGGGYAGEVLGPLFLATAGFGAAGLPITMAATSGVGREQAGLASGLLNTSRQIGGAVGLAAFVVIASTVTAHRAGGAVPSAALLADGYGVALLVGAALVLVAGVGGLALPGTATGPPPPPVPSPDPQPATTDPRHHLGGPP
ncbi:drug resistance transporter, EmrB/QacA subfamily [Klenkia soli]|uniref:Drug resistance transporter, EmrB/QacA subfamily n=1 Tax=Klenkia soli TaxID=1052260 RepID=A0A1H0LM24_9ACTN|nr:MFS transporter [Klenkia soli]SDO69155.1 drug resistance transporter, EmrB/QacA subfamily [Klenkia soli]